MYPPRCARVLNVQGTRYGNFVGIDERSDDNGQPKGLGKAFARGPGSRPRGNVGEERSVRGFNARCHPVLARQ